MCYVLYSSVIFELFSKKNKIKGVLFPLWLCKRVMCVIGVLCAIKTTIKLNFILLCFNCYIRATSNTNNIYSTLYKQQLFFNQ